MPSDLAGLLTGPVSGQSALPKSLLGKIVCDSPATDTGQAGIFAMNADGTGAKPLPRTRDGDQPALSPDGRRIAFHRRIGGDYGSDIWVMNVDGTGLKQVTKDEHGGWPAWSPDGKKIAFHHDLDYTRGSTAVVNADGTGLKHIGRGCGRPSWSPDGRKIVVSDWYMYMGKEFTHNAYVMFAGGGSPKRLAHGWSWDDDPAWSPDGKKIAVVGSCNGQSAMSIWVMNADGKRFRDVAHRWRAATPAWSRDGRKILFADSSAGGNSNLFIMNADGTGLKQVTSNPYRAYYNPDW